MLYDLIVVGGGPAGSTCARKAAQHGLNVLVLEKENHPRRKACGGGVTLRVQEALDLDFTQVVERELCGQRFYYSSGKSKTYLPPDVTGYTVRREDFDHFLLQKAAEAGVTIQQGTRVTDVSEESNRVLVVAGNETYSAKLAIGADGPNSTVARKTGLKPRWNDDEIALCIEAAVPMDPSEILRIVGDPEGSERILLEFYIGFLPRGYAWAFAKKNEFSFGIGAVVNAVSNLKVYWRKFVTSFEKRNGLECNLVGLSAARIPIRGIIEKPYSNRIMLIGDAGGFVRSNTGEGIPYAIKSAKIAADVAMDIVNEVPNVDTMTYYNRAWEAMGQSLITPDPLFIDES